MYLRHLYVAINLGCSNESGCYDGNRDGCHWALLFADLEKCQTFEDMRKQLLKAF